VIYRLHDSPIAGVALHRAMLEDVLQRRLYDAVSDFVDANLARLGDKVLSHTQLRTRRTRATDPPASAILRDAAVSTISADALSRARSARSAIAAISRHYERCRLKSVRAAEIARHNFLADAYFGVLPWGTGKDSIGTKVADS
jgi:hypothetical protein